MKRYSFNIVVFVLMLFIVQAQAGSPMWTYSAPNPASVGVADGELATIQYTVTNQSLRPKTLVLKTTPGLHASVCALTGKGSTCTLTVFASGSQIPLEGLHAGPMMCEQGSTAQCYQPSPGNVLNIIKRVPQGSLSLNTNNVSFMQGQVSSLITLTNTSTFAPVNDLNLTPPANVSLASNSCGSSLPPQGSCTFTVTSTVIGTSSVIISASNASSVSLGVTVNGIPISANPTTLTLTTVSPGNTGVVTITNNAANVVNAENITADLSGAGGTLSAAYSGCTSIPPAGTCTITFTANSTLTTTNIPIQGSNTNPVSVSIAVDQASISASPTSISLTEAGGVSQTVTITNNGPVDAYGIAITSAPGLGVTTSGSCASPLTIGSTCQFTYTPGNHSGSTSATINGTNTNTITQNITVSPAAATSLTATPSVSPAIIDVTGGTSITFTIQNTGTTTAYNLAFALPANWNGISSSSNCINLAPSASCVYTISSSQPNPVGTVGVSADNVSSLQSATVAFQYQGYLVYDVTAVNSSHGTAYVVDTNDESSGAFWQNGCNPTTGVGCITTNATSLTNGSYLSNGNTFDIISAIGSSSSNAAGICYNITTSSGNPVPNGTWYLPAQNELTDACNNLALNGFGNFVVSGYTIYWASTESNNMSAVIIAMNNCGPGTYQKGYSVNLVRCVQAISY